MAGPRTPAGGATADPDKDAKDKVAKDREKQEDTQRRIAMANALKKSTPFKLDKIERIDQPDEDQIKRIEEEKKLAKMGGLSTSPGISSLLVGDAVFDIEYTNTKGQKKKHLVFVTDGIGSIVLSNNTFTTGKFTINKAKALIETMSEKVDSAHPDEVPIVYRDKEWAHKGPLSAEYTIKDLKTMMKAAQEMGRSVNLGHPSAKSLLEYYASTSKDAADEVRRIYAWRDDLDANRAKNAALAKMQNVSTLASHTKAITDSTKPAESVADAIKGKTHDEQLKIIEDRLTAAEERAKKTEAAVKDMEDNIAKTTDTLDQLEKNPTALNRARRGTDKQQEPEEMLKEAEKHFRVVQAGLPLAQASRDGLSKGIAQEHALLDKEISDCKAAIADVKAAVAADPAKATKADELAKKADAVKKGTDETDKKVGDVQKKADYVQPKVKAVQKEIDDIKDKIEQQKQNSGIRRFLPGS